MPAAARLSPQLAFQQSPSGATGAGAGAAEAEAEAAWCWDKGRGRGYLSLFMTGSDPEKVNFTNPAQPRSVKIYILSKKCRSHPTGQITIFMQGVVGKVRYVHGMKRVTGLSPAPRERWSQNCCNPVCLLYIKRVTGLSPAPLEGWSQNWCDPVCLLYRQYDKFVSISYVLYRYEMFVSISYVLYRYEMFCTGSMISLYRCHMLCTASMISLYRYHMFCTGMKCFVPAWLFCTGIKCLPPL